jgi:hypothetical protein
MVFLYQDQGALGPLLLGTGDGTSKISSTVLMASGSIACSLPGAQVSFLRTGEHQLFGRCHPERRTLGAPRTHSVHGVSGAKDLLLHSSRLRRNLCLRERVHPVGPLHSHRSREALVTVLDQDQGAPGPSLLGTGNEDSQITLNGLDGFPSASSTPRRQNFS